MCIRDSPEAASAMSCRLLRASNVDSSGVARTFAWRRCSALSARWPPPRALKQNALPSERRAVRAANLPLKGSPMPPEAISDLVRLDQGLVSRKIFFDQDIYKQE